MPDRNGREFIRARNKQSGFPHYLRRTRSPGRRRVSTCSSHPEMILDRSYPEIIQDRAGSFLSEDTVRSAVSEDTAGSFVSEDATRSGLRSMMLNSAAAWSNTKFQSQVRLSCSVSSAGTTFMHHDFRMNNFPAARVSQAREFMRRGTFRDCSHIA